MKIILVHNYTLYRGGEDGMYETLGRILKERGHEVEMFFRTNAHAQNIRWKVKAFFEGVYSFAVKKEFMVLLKAEKPDVVHIHNIYHYLSPSVLLACREMNIPCVLSCHSYRWMCPVNTFFRDGAICELCLGKPAYWCFIKNCREDVYESLGYSLRNITAELFGLIRDNAAVYVTPSEFTKKKYAEAGYPYGRIVSVPNSIEIPVELEKSGEDKYAAYAGRMSPEKGINTLLSAASRLPQIPLKLAGNGPQLPFLRRTAPSNAIFVGHMHRADMTAFLKGARFMVVPSIFYETFGLVAAEAMAHGMPVIASRIGGLPEVVEDGVTGFLCEPGNVEDFVEKMNILWNDHALCERMGRAGREKAFREYNEEIFYRRMLAVYEQAIEFNRAKKR